MTNKTRKVLYTGVTSDLISRVYRHKQGNGSVFTSKYKTYYLVYVEEFNSISEAIAREKRLKKWKRVWKFELIKEANPEMRDLWNEIITQ